MATEVITAIKATAPYYLLDGKQWCFIVSVFYSTASVSTPASFKTYNTTWDEITSINHVRGLDLRGQQ